MKRHVMSAAAAVAVAVLSAGPAAADCKSDVEAVETKIKQSQVRDKFKGREAEHPEVLVMADGKLVDLTGYIIVDGSVQESWLGDRPVVDNVGVLIKEAKGYIDNKQEAECAGVYQKMSDLMTDKPAAAGQEMAPAGTGTAPAAGTAPAQ